MKNSKYIVLCKKYNNSKNVLFMMNKNDSRINNGNYKVIDEGLIGLKNKYIIGKENIYRIFEDWSLKTL